MKFSRPGYWSGWPFPSPGDLPNPGIEPRSPALWVDSLLAELQGKPKNTGGGSLSLLQQIFLTQELNLGVLHCRCILYQLSYQGSPGINSYLPIFPHHFFSSDHSSSSLSSSRKPYVLPMVGLGTFPHTPKSYWVYLCLRLHFCPVLSWLWYDCVFMSWSLPLEQFKAGIMTYIPPYHQHWIQCLAMVAIQYLVSSDCMLPLAVYYCLFISFNPAHWTSNVYLTLSTWLSLKVLPCLILEFILILCFTLGLIF